MSLLAAMLPFYLLGNLHCLGMCGPLVMMIGHHRYRAFYFLGRLLSFTLAGTAAGALGAVLNVFFQEYHIAAATSFLFGGIIVWIGLATLFGLAVPGWQKLSRITAPFHKAISLLLLQDRAFPTFLFGFFTIALPCGQTILVYAACALSGDALVGTLNGFAFALLTSPSLLLAMQAQKIFRSAARHYNNIVALFALLIGSIALLRGLAETGVIPHLILSPAYHIVLY